MVIINDDTKNFAVVNRSKIMDKIMIDEYGIEEYEKLSKKEQEKIDKIIVLCSLEN